jgi:hypothetical protein
VPDQAGEASEAGRGGGGRARPVVRDLVGGGGGEGLSVEAGGDGAGPPGVGVGGTSGRWCHARDE